MRANAAFTADGSRADTACVAASKAWPVCPPFWCRTNTAKISPKSIPAAMRAMPPNTRSRRAPMAGNVAATLAGILVIAIVQSLPSVARPGQPRAPRSPSLICRSCLRWGRPKCRHHMFGEQMLRLDALPVLQAAEVGDNRQLTDATLVFQYAYLADDFFWRADKADLLANNLVVGQLGQ